MYARTTFRYSLFRIDAVGIGGIRANQRTATSARAASRATA
jgi:hypothetical protein